MVKHLSKANKQVTIQGWLAVSIFVWTPFAVAENLNDPTRPPASIDRPTEDSSVRATGPVLQSVLISPSRKVAIINGETVKLGDKFGDARVVKIAETEVVLRNGNDVQVLKLFPQVEKKPNPGRPNANTNVGRQ
jgi:MSHA biogenesis protein MshK